MQAKERRMAMAKKLSPVHPGEILREEFLAPMKLTPYGVAARLGVCPANSLVSCARWA